MTRCHFNVIQCLLPVELRGKNDDGKPWKIPLEIPKFQYKYINLTKYCME